MSKETANNIKTIRCPKCGDECALRAIACRNCGTMLKDIDATSGRTTVIVPRPKTDVDIDYDPTLAGTSKFRAGSVLYLSIERVNSPIARYIHTEPIIIGREDTEMLGKQDINLSPYSARERGVSRKHAQVYLRDGELYIEDLNSSNGTSLNDDNLTPFQPYKIRDGDEIMLGHMMVWVNF
jgi:phage FluMu protein Com